MARKVLKVFKTSWHWYYSYGHRPVLSFYQLINKNGLARSQKIPGFINSSVKYALNNLLLSSRMAKDAFNHIISTMLKDLLD
ncbi:MAG TPA: hypothetical protein VF700_07925 [Segetibacter sp.]